ncbi:ferulic acid esterase A faeA [Chaetomium sp. MPI-SDFR-AT-0129]|nr:ferulic acid esterase A faeA [Chaetomium sp. MPI-SDFR-AT-0129]
MHWLSPFVGLLALAAAAPSPPTTITEPVKGIDNKIFKRIVHFLKIAQATYAGDSCHIKNVPRLATFYNATTDIYGWISRDDATRELIISFRGTVSDINHDQNLNSTLADMSATLPECVGCKSHGGYYLNWLSIQDQVYARLQEQQEAYPDYSLIVTGHSLGGGLAGISSAHFLARGLRLTTYTYGEPRISNPAFADWLDLHFKTGSLKTTRYLRTTHADDGIIPIPATSLGYRHQGLELWALDPPSAQNTWVCPPEGFCAEASNNGTGINTPHIFYFGVGSGNCTKTV